MKELLILMTTVLIGTSCLYNKSDESAIAETKEQKTTKEVQDSNIKVLNTTDHSGYFVRSLKEEGIRDVTLVDNMFIQSEVDTTYFPEYPEIGQKIVLTANKESTQINLRIKRSNQTTIDYWLSISAPNTKTYKAKGKASLHPQFYLGAEVDENTHTGTAYFSHQYMDHSNDDKCSTHIRLGRSNKNSMQILGKLIKNCNGDFEGIGLNDFPTLVQKEIE